MGKFERNWFDSFQINFHQAPEGLIAIHAFKRGVRCEYFEVPVQWLKLDDFFERVYAKTQELWALKEQPRPRTCPVCKNSFIAFDFRYHGKKYCRTCGSHYEIDGTNVVIIRSILE